MFLPCCTLGTLGKIHAVMDGGFCHVGLAEFTCQPLSKFFYGKTH